MPKRFDNDYRPIVLSNGTVGNFVQHLDLDAAKEEARRLAGVETNKTFVVYVPVLLVRTQDAPIEEIEIPQEPKLDLSHIRIKPAERLDWAPMPYYPTYPTYPTYPGVYPTTAPVVTYNDNTTARKGVEL